MGGVETDLDGRTSVPGPVRRRRGGVHARARRQPSRQQFAARGPGVRRARRPSHGRSAARERRPAARRSFAMIADRLAAGVDRCRDGRGRDPRADVEIGRACSASARGFATPCSLLHEQQAALDDRLAARPDARSRGLAACEPRDRGVARRAGPRSAARRAVAGTSAPTFPAHDDLKWKIHVSDVGRPEGRHYE